MNELEFVRELQLHSTAAYFDLTSKKGRHASVQAVEDFFFQLCKVFEPALFIEAGAKDARVSRRARRYLPKARIVAFEANPHTFSACEGRLDQKHHIEYLNLALDETAGIVDFQLIIKSEQEKVDAQAGHHSLLVRADAAATYEPIPVRSVNLDGFFAGDLRSCALWIDVEGATKRVLSGAQEVLGLASHLLIEVEDRPLWSEQWLRPQVMAFLADAGFTPVVRDFQSRYQYNILFVSNKLLEMDRFRHTLATYFSMIGVRSRTGT